MYWITSTGKTGYPPGMGVVKLIHINRWYGTDLYPALGMGVVKLIHIN